MSKLFSVSRLIFIVDDIKVWACRGDGHLRPLHFHCHTWSHGGILDEDGFLKGKEQNRENYHCKERGSAKIMG